MSHYILEKMHTSIENLTEEQIVNFIRREGMYELLESKYGYPRNTLQYVHNESIQFILSEELSYSKREAYSALEAQLGTKELKFNREEIPMQALYDLIVDKRIGTV